MKMMTLISSLVFLLCQVCNASPQQRQAGQIVLSSPSGQTVPPEITRSLATQEERLSNINVRMATLEHSVDDFRHDIGKQLDSINANLKELAATNNVMNFIIWIFKVAASLTVPAILGLWFKNWLERRATAAQIKPDQ